MKLFFTILTSMIVFSVFSQEQENLNQNYNLYEGEISVITDNTYQFGNKILFVINTRDSFNEIFKRGIIYPDIFIVSKQNDNIQTKTEINDSSALTMKFIDGLFDLYSNDSLTISDFKEIKKSKRSKNIRRFEFLLFENRHLNPIRYTIEIINNKSSKKTDLEVFIKGARLYKLFKGALLL